VVSGSEKLSSVKLAHLLVKKQNGLCKKKGPTRQKDFKEKLMSYEKRGSFEKNIHTFARDNIMYGVWCTSSGNTTTRYDTYRLFLVDLLVPGMVPGTVGP